MKKRIGSLLLILALCFTLLPTAALAFWMTLVNSRPTRIPSSGLEKEVSASINTWLSRRGETASLIMDMPYISTAKPRRMSPT